MLYSANLQICIASGLKAALMTFGLLASLKFNPVSGAEF